MMKKQNKWSDALILWQAAAGKGDLDSCIEISKYFEHIIEDYNLAIQWIDEAFNISENTSYSNKKLTERLNHRKSRLECKINSTNEK
jgi:hypothetical protein